LFAAHLTPTRPFVSWFTGIQCQYVAGENQEVTSAAVCPVASCLNSAGEVDAACTAAGIATAAACNGTTATAGGNCVFHSTKDYYREAYKKMNDFLPYRDFPRVR
jgi:hypothetical protein